MPAVSDAMLTSLRALNDTALVSACLVRRPPTPGSTTWTTVYSARPCRFVPAGQGNLAALPGGLEAVADMAVWFSFGTDVRQQDQVVDAATSRVYTVRGTNAGRSDAVAVVAYARAGT